MDAPATTVHVTLKAIPAVTVIDDVEGVTTGPESAPA